MQQRIFLTSSFVLGLLAAQGSVKIFVLGFSALALWLLWGAQVSPRRTLMLGLLAMLLGLVRVEIDQRLWQAGACPDVPKGVAVSGRILDSPRSWGRSLVFFLAVDQVDHRPFQPTVLLVRWSDCAESVAVGDRWSLTGRLTRGEEASFPGGFSQRQWLWGQRARGVFRVGRFDQASYLGPPEGWGPSALAARLRQHMLDRLDGIKDQRARALVCGVVFGDTQALPKEVAEMFRRTGTSHLLAASGMNVALLIAMVTMLARWCGYGAWRSAPFTIPLVIGYAHLAGCAPSISRAAAGGVMSLVACWLGRRSGAWNSLCLSIWILLLWEPRQVYDLGFGLSVAAVVGLLAGPKLPASAPNLCHNALLTVSATFVTLPLMWTSFHEISSTFLPANLLLGPLVEALFPLGLLLTLCPVRPLSLLVEAIARLSLVLVELLSGLADPVPLAHPSDAALILLIIAIGLWLGAGGRWGRGLAVLLASATLVGSHLGSALPKVAAGELWIRRIGSQQPYYWLSSQREELLVLSGAWQESRARQAILAMGCSREVKLHILPKGAEFQASWGAFRWGKVAPLVPKNSPYLEVRTCGSTYSVHTWRPPDEH